MESHPDIPISNRVDCTSAIVLRRSVGPGDGFIASVPVMTVIQVPFTFFPGANRSSELHGLVKVSCAAVSAEGTCVAASRRAVVRIFSLAISAVSHRP